MPECSAGRNRQGGLAGTPMNVAYLASTVTLPSSPTRRQDFHEHVYTMENLRPAMEARGMTLDDIAWDDPSVDWANYDLVMIGTTWDYWDRVPEFFAKLEDIESVTRLYNSSALVKWNSRKTYLKELEAKGAKLIPTVWIETADEASVRAAFDALETDDLVIKRQIGAGADGQHRLKRGDPIPEMPHPMMAQGFLSSIQTEGEFSFIFIDGAFSHCLIKRPSGGDYRIQSLYGGVEEPVDPPAEDLSAAEAIISVLDEPPLYGRVDMVRGEDGKLLLMELELIEPYLYPVEGPQLGERIAAAVARKLGV